MPVGVVASSARADRDGATVAAPSIVATPAEPDDADDPDDVGDVGEVDGASTTGRPGARSGAAPVCCGTPGRPGSTGPAGRVAGRGRVGRVAGLELTGGAGRELVGGVTDQV